MVSFHLKTVRAEWLNKKVGDSLEMNGFFFKIVKIYKNGSMGLEGIDGYKSKAGVPKNMQDAWDYKKREKLW